MKRIVLAVAVLVAGLSAASAPARANDFDLCQATDTTVTNDQGLTRINLDYTITAHPMSPDPTQPNVTAECAFMVDTPTGLKPAGRVTNTVPGPVGFLYLPIAFTDPPEGIDYYVCTRVWTSPIMTIRDHGCHYAFTW